MGRTIQLRIGRRLVTAGFSAPREAARLAAQGAAVSAATFAPGDPVPPPAPDAPPTVPAPGDAPPAPDSGPPVPAPADGPPPPAPDDPTVARWEGPVAMEGQLTGDGRLLEDGSLYWEGLPLPLRWDIEDDGNHAGAVVTGLCETLERQAGGVIWGTGFIDLISDDGWEAARLMDRGMLRGVSIDPDTVDYEIRVAGEIYDQAMAPPSLFIDIASGQIVDADGNPAEAPPEPPRDAEGRVVVASYKNDDEVMVVTSARVRAMTLVDTPAFIGAQVQLVGGLPPRPSEDEMAGPMLVPLMAGGAINMASVVAAAPPARPPAGWFADPGLPGPTPMTVTDDGRVYGHLALWGTCHLGYASCVQPPRSATGYAWFHTGVLTSADGSEVPVGQITIDTGHAGTAASAHAAVAHYDNTGRAVVDLCVGDDEHGVWMAGALRPGVSEGQKRALRASSPSGDWRQVGGNLELCAILGVNMPGFPVPRAQGLVASGRPLSLLLPGPTIAEPVLPLPAVGAPGLTADEVAKFRAIVAAGDRQDQARRGEAASLARAVEAGELARGMVG